MGLFSIANLRISEYQWGLKTAPLVVGVGITEYPGLAHGRYEGMNLDTVQAYSVGPGLAPLHSPRSTGL